MTSYISDVQWKQYREEGYARIGRVATGEELRALQNRIDDIMLGEAPLDYDRMLMQLDREPGADGPGPQTNGHKGATLSYRKIQSLEFDPLFLSYMQKPLFREACAKVYGEETRITCYRAMFMNKPAREGTQLNWHQDRWSHLDREPLLTIYTALDPATEENGCVRIIPNSHRLNRVPLTRPDERRARQERIVAESESIPLELEAGEVVLMHNWMFHSSGVNSSDVPRRAFSVCYMPAETKSRDGLTYSRIFGTGALSVSQLTG